jgi:hypothetical protein
MTDSKQPLDIEELQTDSGLAFEMLAEAIEQLTDAVGEWVASSHRLTQATLDRVNSLNDPAYGGLRVQVAAELTDELARLPEPEGPLVRRVRFLLLALQKALLDLTRQISQMMSALVDDKGALNELGDAFEALRTAFLAAVQNPDSSESKSSADLDAALARAQDLMTAANEPAERYKVLMAGAIVAINEVSKTMQAAAILLTTRLNHLVEFLDRTDPPSKATGAPRGRFVRTFVKAGISEAALESLKQGIEIGIEQLVKEVAKPLTLGLSVLIDTALRFREKRKALQEQQENLEKLAKMAAGPGASDYMWMLTADFRKSETGLLELVELVDEFTERLQTGLA